eukprot:6979735-Alexandrium_andersonii.AAC.1
MPMWALWAALRVLPRLRLGLSRRIVEASRPWPPAARASGRRSKSPSRRAGALQDFAASELHCGR